MIPLAWIGGIPGYNCPMTGGRQADPPEGRDASAGDGSPPRPERKWSGLILHIHPRNVPGKTLDLTLTWGLGGMSVVLVLLLAGTGILLLFAYEPSPERAYESILALQGRFLFGGFVRNIHHWSGNALIAVAFLHLLRVYLTGAFHPPRQLNWTIGMVLFLLVLLSGFTGYLLPWDQLAYWAVTICTSMLETVPLIGPSLQRLVRGGAEIGPTTLSIFYALHIAILPALLFLLMPFHFWRVRKAGGLVIPYGPDEEPPRTVEYVPTIPNLTTREFTAGLVIIAFVLCCAVFANAPLGAKANPGMSPNPAKAPWYFLGVQELMLHFHPLFSVLVVPTAVVFLFLFLPYMKYDLVRPGVWLISRNGRASAVWASVAALAVTPLAILADEYLVSFDRWIPGIPSAISTGLLPFGICLASSLGGLAWLRRKFNLSKSETMQASLLFLLVAFLVLTVTGVAFRGEGMKLALF
jgi:quinol-cytochrome oxidoreductase complex cytochrome b subunit